MPTEFPDDGTIDELLRLAGVSTERSAARRWLESALVAARGTPEPRLVPQPSPAKHNAPLDEIERASNRLIAALKQLRSHPLKVPKPEKTEVLAAFAAHKGEVTAGYVEFKRG